MITDSDIKALKNYFENCKDFAFAFFLFGSEAKGIAFVVRKLMGWGVYGF